MKRFALLVLLPLLAAMPLPALAEDVQLQLGEKISWEGSEPANHFLYGDMRMAIRPDYPEGETDWIESATLLVKSKEYGNFSVPSTAGMSGYGGLGVYEVDGEGGVTIVFDTYTGGAHCCTQTSAIWLGSDEPVITDVGMFNGGYSVEDIDGDGISEIAVSDDRFLYAFDSYAASFPPVMILKARGGEIYDATAEPAFRDVVERDFESMAEFCYAEEGFYASACAGMLADAALLGRYASAREDFVAAVNAGTSFYSGWEEYSFCDDDQCETQTEYSDFLEAVESQLYAWGYLKS